MLPARFAAFNRTKERRVAGRVAKADTYWTRSRGLLGRSSLDPDEGLWIVPCPSIHTLFMKFSIDVIFLDKDLKAVRVIENLRPWRLSPWILRAHSVLELAGGTLNGSISAGDQLEIFPRVD